LVRKNKKAIIEVNDRVKMTVKEKRKAFAKIKTRKTVWVAEEEKEREQGKILDYYGTGQKKDKMCLNYHFDCRNQNCNDTNQ
jgi:hypothetical protein